MVVAGAQSAGVSVTLLQLPIVYRYYAEAIREYARGRRQESISFEMKGPGGKVTLFDIRQDDDIGALAERLREILE